MAKLMSSGDSADNALRISGRENCVYTSCYCEENVWLLCDEIRKTQYNQLPNLYAVFISNDKQMIPLWEQKASGDGEFVCWDYHVVLLYVNGRHSAIYDLDSTLPFPTPFSVYAKRAIRSDLNILPPYHRKVRVIPAEQYLLTFSSDRAHMKNSDGTFKASPPNYPCIQTSDCDNNIQEFISMDASVGVGKVMTSQEFIKMILESNE